jgi:hypothetical protein
LTPVEPWNDEPRAVGMFSDGKKGDAVSGLVSLSSGSCSGCRGWIWEAKSECFGLELARLRGGRMGCETRQV